VWFMRAGMTPNGRISDPAPLRPGMKQQLNRGVRCIRCAPDMGVN
jgi:hypothetical protein